jgi:predicted alpha/beta-hydrolase family hydrolase
MRRDGLGGADPAMTKWEKDRRYERHHAVPTPIIECLSGSGFASDTLPGGDPAGAGRFARDVTVDQLTIQVDASHSVSGLLQVPGRAFACMVLAHGAGAGMTHRFMAAVADGLAARGVATLRFQFPYMEAGSKRPDRPPLAHATVRAAVASATRLTANLPLFSGGKSFGARMTSQAQAEAPLPGVRGLTFFGFPLHPASKPSDERGRHLADVKVPMLFVQGTKDALADTKLLVPMVQALGVGATLKLIEAADHSFHVPVRSGRTDEQVLVEVLDDVASWVRVNQD